MESIGLDGELSRGSRASSHATGLCRVHCAAYVDEWWGNRGTTGVRSVVGGEGSFSPNYMFEIQMG